MAKFYIKKTLDTNNAQSDGFAQDISGNLITTSPGSIELPRGNTGERPTSDTQGQLRYNTDLKEAEGLINTIWERIRTVRPASIIVENLGVGDDTKTVFGPLNINYSYSYIRNNGYAPQNLIVYVENVWQCPYFSVSVPGNYYLDDGSSPGVGGTTGRTYVIFTSPVPLDKPVYCLYGFDGYFPPAA